jgi:hypothetical protein
LAKEIDCDWYKSTSNITWRQQNRQTPLTRDPRSYNAHVSTLRIYPRYIWPLAMTSMGCRLSTIA